MIPKIIHYCWFGGNKIPPHLKEYMRSWSRLKGYRMIQWDETNCSFDENVFVRKMKKEKRWAFVTDYYRLKRVYDYGGIYLDTDVRIQRPFDELLDKKCFLGFSYDCCIGTAVFGAEKGNPLIGELLELYEKSVPCEEALPAGIDYAREAPRLSKWEANNYIWTWNMLYNHPRILLNNKFQEEEDFTLYPKEYFEVGRVFGKYFCVHFNEGSWKNDVQIRKRENLKKVLLVCPPIYRNVQIMVRQYRYRKANRLLPFYSWQPEKKK